MSGEKNKKMEIRFPENHRPVFANSVQISVSNEEVTFQFVFLRPNIASGSLVGEVILTPQHAIRFKNALGETIKTHFTKNLFKPNEGQK